MKEPVAEAPRYSTVVQYPWQRPELSLWSIVGMNHYRMNGERWLFVAMARGGRLIKSEGLDCWAIWEDLAGQALLLEPLFHLQAES